MTPEKILTAEKKFSAKKDMDVNTGMAVNTDMAVDTDMEKPVSSTVGSAKLPAQPSPSSSSIKKSTHSPPTVTTSVKPTVAKPTVVKPSSVKVKPVPPPSSVPSVPPSSVPPSSVLPSVKAEDALPGAQMSQMTPDEVKRENEIIKRTVGKQSTVYLEPKFPLPDIKYDKNVERIIDKYPGLGKGKLLDNIRKDMPV
jgi:hypothetical protein